MGPDKLPWSRRAPVVDVAADDDRAAAGDNEVDVRRALVLFGARHLVRGSELGPVQQDPWVRVTSGFIKSRGFAVTWPLACSAV